VTRSSDPSAGFTPFPEIRALDEMMANAGEQPVVLTTPVMLRQDQLKELMGDLTEVDAFSEDSLGISLFPVGDHLLAIPTCDEPSETRSCVPVLRGSEFFCRCAYVGPAPEITMEEDRPSRAVCAFAAVRQPNGGTRTECTAVGPCRGRCRTTIRVRRDGRRFAGLRLACECQ
jgi:hypothetical protein